MMEPRCSSQGRSSRIYRIGEKNRKRFDREEESYLMSRIINEKDYITVPTKFSKMNLDATLASLLPTPRRIYIKHHPKNKSQNQNRSTTHTP